MECIEDVPDADITVVTDEADNCDAALAVAHVGDQSDGNTCPKVITRTFSVTDACGNSTNVTQTITVHDVTDPTASNPSPIDVECIEDVPDADIAVVTDEADNCGTPTVAFVSDSSDGNTCPEVITRTYSVTDACGNSTNVTQTITVSDTTDPTASNPTGIDVECIEDVPDADIAVVTDEADNCGTPTVAFVSDSSDGNTCPEVITRTYSVTDACGNSTNVTQAITISDTTPPTIVVPSNLVVECDSALEPGSPDVSDNCGLDTVVFKEMEQGPCDGKVTTLTLLYSGTSEALVEISHRVRPGSTRKSVFDALVQPGEIFTFEGAEDDGTLGTQINIVVDGELYTNIHTSCSVDVGPGLVVGDFEVISGESRDGGLLCPIDDEDCKSSCNYMLVRTWTATDLCGNSASATQLVMVVDTTAPTASDPPPVSAQCEAPVPDIDVVTDAADNCAPFVTVEFVGDVSDGNTCPEIIIRTYSVTDDCGNSTNVTQTITVNDTVAPVISGCPSQLVDLGCNPDLPTCEIATLGVVAEDNCDGIVDVDCVPGELIQSGCNFSQDFSLTSTDACGNESDPCVVTYTWKEDTTGPVLAGLPSGGDLGCNPDLPSCDETVRANDNCDGAVDVSCTPGAVTGDACSRSQVFTYAAVDACGNETSTDVTYTWKEDVTGPVLAGLPSGGDLGCNPDLPSCDETMTANDNCDGAVDVSCTPGAVTGDACSRSQVFTYAAVDACGNESSTDVTYTWKEDTTGPVLAGLPSGGDLGCNPDLPSCDETVTANDNCDGAVDVSCTPGTVTGDACSRSQVFTYAAVDACGNESSTDVTYTWKEDVTGPVFAGLPSGGELGCNPDLPSCDETVTANDNCDGAVDVSCTPGTVTGDACSRSQVFTYAAVDACGNESSTDVTYTWKEDVTGPVFAGLPSGGELGCNPDLPSCDETVTANDNCDGAVDVSCTPGAVTGDACSRSQVFTYAAVDACGNESSTDVTYTWTEDTTGPVLAGLPSGGDLGCNPDLPSCDETVTANDNCDGAVDVSCTPGAVTGDACSRSQVFTYAAVDACGNESSTDVTYTWKEDVTGPVLAGLPSGGDLGCNPDLPSCDEAVTANDNCDGAVDVSCTPGAVTGDACSRSQVFTYAAVDACGNETSTDVTYTWKEDVTGPVLAGLPSGGDLGCNPDLPSCDETVTANDNCDGAVDVSCTPGAVTGDACSRSQVFTYAAVDACGNESSTDVTYTWKEDVTGPVFAGLPSGGDLGCNPDLPSCDETVTANDNCDGAVDVSCTPGAVTGDACSRSQVFTYAAVDACGNESSTDVTYTWKEDTTPPVLVCNLPPFFQVPSIVILGPGQCEGRVPDFVNGVQASDNCSGSVPIMQEPVAGSLFTNSVTVILRAQDECGNVATSVCDVFVECNIETACQMSGLVWQDGNANGQFEEAGVLGEAPLSNITVRLVNADTQVVSQEVQTDSQGVFTFGSDSAGNYYVEVDESTLPEGLVPSMVNTNPSEAVFYDPLSEEGCPEFAFPYVEKCDVCGVVWFDVNGDGLTVGDDLSLLGLNNVTVRLLNPDRTVVATTVTSTGSCETSVGSDGAIPGVYVFENVPSGTYLIEVDTSSAATGLLASVNASGESPLESVTFSTPLQFVLTCSELGPDTVEPTAGLPAFPDFGLLLESTAVELASFTATRIGEGVRLDWTTAVELDNLGFNIYRSDSQEGARVKVNGEMVPGQGSAGGFSYSLLDPGASPGANFYWLEDVDLNFSVSLYGPVYVAPEEFAPVLITGLQVGAATGVSSASALDAPMVRLTTPASSGAPLIPQYSIKLRADEADWVSVPEHVSEASGDLTNLMFEMPTPEGVNSTLFFRVIERQL